MEKPQNHVTRAMADRQFTAQDDPKPDMLPRIPEDLLLELEDTYPQRCRRIAEPELLHERYAGAADLVVLLRKRFEQQKLVADDPDPDPPEE